MSHLMSLSGVKRTYLVAVPMSALTQSGHLVVDRWPLLKSTRSFRYGGFLRYGALS